MNATDDFDLAKETATLGPYPCECFECGCVWTSLGESNCPRCGHGSIGVADCPEGALMTWDEEVDEL